jgi:hypothetical protein
MTTDTSQSELDAAIDAIETAYEYFLAYAAQGRRTDRDLSPAQGPRGHLTAMTEALAVLPALVRASVAKGSSTLIDDCSAFFDALERDARVAAAAARLVLAQDEITSQLVDNLNASIHLRAVLTDVFLIDEALKTTR